MCPCDTTRVQQPAGSAALGPSKAPDVGRSLDDLRGHFEQPPSLGAGVTAHQGEGLIGVHTKAVGQHGLGLFDVDSAVESCCELVYCGLSRPSVHRADQPSRGRCTDDGVRMRRHRVTDQRQKILRRDVCSYFIRCTGLPEQVRFRVRRVLVTCKIGAPCSERRSCAVHAATCNRWVPDRMGGARNSQEQPDDSDVESFSRSPKHTVNAGPSLSFLLAITPAQRVSPGQVRDGFRNGRGADARRQRSSAQSDWDSTAFITRPAWSHGYSAMLISRSQPRSPATAIDAEALHRGHQRIKDCKGLAWHEGTVPRCRSPSRCRQTPVG